MEHTLRCNSLKCRTQLGKTAVVTTCSHVFCEDCSKRCQLSDRREGQLAVCPACDMHLTNPDDVVLTNLNPTEDYKTSVLSGLSPNVIMECAGRALSFWAYQTTQEIVYQEYLVKNLTDKHSSLNTQMDKIIHDANDEISNLRNKMSNMVVDQDNLRCKNEELIQAFREKSRKLLQTQELYDKMKRRHMLGQVQGAASDAVDDTIQAPVTAARFVDRVGSQNQSLRPTHPPQFSAMQNNCMQYPGGAPAGVDLAMGASSGWNGNGDRTWAGFSSQGSQQNNQTSRTPSTHRQRLAPGIIATPRGGSATLQPNTLSRTPMPRSNSTGRSPLTNLNGNSGAGIGFAGYGMSAGLKVSNLAGLNINGFTKPIIRSRVAQRPASGIQTNRTGFSPSQTGNMFSTGENFY